MNILEPIGLLLQDKGVSELIQETARLYYSSGDFTINLVPGLIAAIAVVVLLPMFLDFSDTLPVTLPVTTGYGQTLFSRTDSSYYDPTSATLEQSIGQLQQQVSALQESEAALRSAVEYYNGPVNNAVQSTDSVAYTS